jgi:galactonate dehydratase
LVPLVRADADAGGITEGRRIAAPLDFAMPNLLIQEHFLGIHYNTDNDLLDHLVDAEVSAFVDGSDERTDRSGLGVEIDESAVRSADARSKPWRTPVWRRSDGSFAQW